MDRSVYCLILKTKEKYSHLHDSNYQNFIEKLDAYYVYYFMYNLCISLFSSRLKYVKCYQLNKKFYYLIRFSCLTNINKLKWSGGGILERNTSNRHYFIFLYLYTYGRESILFGTNFQNWAFDEIIRYKVLWVQKSCFKGIVCVYVSEIITRDWNLVFKTPIM